MEEVVGWAWDIFQPLLFGLIGAEIQVSKLEGYTVGETHTHTHTHTHNEVAVITERFKFDCMDVNIFAWPKEKPLESFTSLVCVQEIHKPPSVLAFICCTGVPVGELVGKQILDFSQ